MKALRLATRHHKKEAKALRVRYSAARVMAEQLGLNMDQVNASKELQRRLATSARRVETDKARKKQESVSKPSIVDLAGNEETIKLSDDRS